MASLCLLRRIGFKSPFLGHTLRPLQRLHTRSTSSSLPSISKCPSPICACASTPDLDIDRVKPLINTVPSHSRHVAVHTGRDDWASRIEDDAEAPNVAKELKALLGPKGEFYEATLGNIMVTNCSSGPASTVSIYPDSRVFMSLRQYQGVYHDFIRMLLLPEEQRSEPAGKLPFRVHARKDGPTIFICGHGGRDSRCGVMGSLLRDEFEAHINRISRDRAMSKPEVALISHIGGHVFAGNVIIYFPPHPQSHSLAGKGVWYGRVEPRHVEGILMETVIKGRVIEEFFRGGLDSEGRALTLGG